MPPGNKPPSDANERGLSLKAHALYGFRRFRECHNKLVELNELYPGKGDALLKRCETRLEEEKGHYDWASMLEQAQSSDPEMDRATYIGPIEVRPCPIESHGRGLFTTKNVDAGELLLCEKAFSAAFAREESEVLFMEENEEEVLRLRAELATKTFVKLIRNPSLQGNLEDLFPGPDADEERDGKGKVVVDEYVLLPKAVSLPYGFG